MAEAVSNASIFCCFMTPEYEKSRACKHELERADKLGKRIIPCMVSNRKIWKPSDSSWLGFLTDPIIAIDFSDTDTSQAKLDEKTKELVRRIKNQPSNPTPKTSSSPVKLFESFKEKYLRENKIKRIMNEERSFSIEQSYINLAIVETKEQQEKEKKLKQRDQTIQEQEDEQNSNIDSHNNDILGTFEEIHGVKTAIEVENMFDKCKDKTNKVLVLGRAGIGKSTFCQYVTYRWAKGDLWSDYNLVVLIYLRKLTDSRYPSGTEYSLVHLLKKEYFPCDDLSSEQKDKFKELCNKQKVLWILDGYDEFVQNIPEQLKKLFDHLRETQHHILTSRPYAIAIPYDVKMEIIGFTDENIINYVNQFFNQLNDELPNASFEGEKLLKFLESNSSIWGVAHIPVNLELICSLWSNPDWSESTVLTMAGLYHNMIQWLCRRYLKRRNINHENMSKRAVYEECNKELEFYEHLAFRAMESNQIIFPPELLEEIEDETKIFLHKNPELLNMGFVKSYDENPVGNRIQTMKQYYFIHLSFQEHFAARHFLTMLKNSNRQRAIHFIHENKYNQRFRMVFIFASGLLGQSDYKSCLDIFWKTIEDEPLDIIGVGHIKLLIACLDELIDLTVFRERAHYLKLISQWLMMCTRRKQKYIQTNLIQSLNRTNSLMNTSYMQRKLIEMLQTKDEDTKLNVLELISKLKISKPNTKLLSLISVNVQHEQQDIRNAACDSLGNMGEKAATKDIIDTLMKRMRDDCLDIMSNARQVICRIAEKAATKEIIDALINAMADEESLVRWNACETLGKIGEKAATNEVIDTFINAMRDDDYYLRTEVCKALGHMGEKAATNEMINILINAMGDKTFGDRSKVCETLGTMGKKAATNEVISALIYAMGDTEIRWNACAALVNIGEKVVTTVIDILINAVGDEDYHVRSNIYTVLGKMGEKRVTNEMIDALINGMRDTNPSVRSKAFEALGNMGGKAAVNEVINALVNAMRDKNSDDRLKACEALGKIGEEAATNELIDALINAMRDQSSDVRSKACGTLRNIGEKVATNEIIEALIKAMTDEDWRVRWDACATLADMGEKTATNQIIDALIDAMENQYSDVRRKICEALGNMGEKTTTKKVMDALINAMGDQDWEVRCIACRGLSKLNEKASTKVIDALINGMRDKNSYVQRSACKAFSEMGEKVATKKVIIALINTIGDKDYDVRSQVCEALGKMGEQGATDEVISVLLNAMQDSVYSVRLNACEALGEVAGEAVTSEVVNALSNAIRDEKYEVRWKACKALGKLGEKTATRDVMDALISAIENEDSTVRWRACAGLGNMGEKAATKEVIRALMHAMQDEHYFVRWSACEALEHIQMKPKIQQSIFNDFQEYIIHSTSPISSDLIKYL
ncbi:unnamed protein product [Rotaria magnacalcarata]|uniref:NACHT domain-containing protein n=1 Tax=Rotaria magnacalcarata TaxID=392030 RepID=A0A819UIK0_9BILA|nr:unnamed protein product [Rotaria magnacalcarata]CAF4080666.1 unnamed protein product [Rotaria magnacalcarata]